MQDGLFRHVQGERVLKKKKCGWRDSNPHAGEGRGF